MTERLRGLASILLIDDQAEALCPGLEVCLSDHELTPTRDPETGMARLQGGGVDLVFLGMRQSPRLTNMADEEGLALLAHIRESFPATPVVMTTTTPDIDFAVRAMREGAYSVLCMPATRRKVLDTVNEALRGRPPAEATAPSVALDDGGTRYGAMVGCSPAMRSLYEQIEVLATKDVSLLILGENGVGKDLAAREIHNRSERPGQFIRVNLGAVAETLFESELFGHKKGAFTHATEDRTGRFVAADGGTLFLNELCEMPPACQALLLSALEDGEITPVGDNTPVKVDVRFLSATNHDVMAAQREGRLRMDLYYRVGQMALEIPPLRERGDDVLLLAETILRARSPDAPKRLSASAKTRLLDYSWPGNVRQLDSVIKTTVFFVNGDVIEAEDLQGMDGQAPTPVAGAPSPVDSLWDRVRAGEGLGSFIGLKSKYGSEVVTALIVRAIRHKRSGRGAGEFLGFVRKGKDFNNFRKHISSLGIRVRDVLDGEEE